MRLAPRVDLDTPLCQAGRLILMHAGEDLDREGIRRTPERFANAYRFLLDGYEMTVQDAIGEGVFEAEGQGDLVAVRGIEFYSLCEHHVLPFWGQAEIRYYPDGKILGLSKFPRLVDIFARRLQVQERLTHQVAQAVMDAVQARAVHVRIVAQHLCMMMRGVEKQLSDTLTEVTLGIEQLNSFQQARLLQPHP